MPNQPHATSARSAAGTFAPRTPKLARHSTGNDTPYFVPACALSIIGMSTIVLPRRMVSIAWAQAMLTILLGNTIVLIPMMLNAHAGTKYGVSFPVLCRASFGVRGANIPAILRAIV